MIVRRSERQRFENSPVCTGFGYGHDDKDVNIVVIDITGRYPSKGRVINKICKEVVLVMEGKGKVGIDGKEYQIDEGDSILIQPNQKFFWDGKMKLAMVCIPAFKPEQHVECD